MRALTLWESVPEEKSTMKKGTKNEMKGNLHEAAGKAKAKIGRVTGDADLEAEGRGQQTGGKIQKKAGQIQRVFDK